MLAAAFGCAALGFTSCDDDKDTPVLVGHGIENAGWNEINNVDVEGETLDFEFEAKAKWTATAADEWVHVLTANGGAGKSTLSLEIDPMEDDVEERSTSVEIKVDGYSEPCIVNLYQGDAKPKKPGQGVENAEWKEVNDVDLNGQTLIFEFKALAKWTATSVDEWVHVLTTNGGAGLSSLRLKVDPNEGDDGRSSTVTLKVEGYAEPCLITLRQGDGFIEKGDGRYRTVNEWIYEYMAERYLWDEHIPELRLDYSLDYQQFLDQMLNGVAAFDNVNAEDGHWENGARKYWYTYIDSNSPISRSPGDINTDSGLMLMGGIITDAKTGQNHYGLAVVWCTPGSPAYLEGVSRGDFITKVNNVEITEDNYQRLGGMAINGNCTLELNKVEFNGAGAATLTNYKTTYIGKDSYTDPAIYANKVLQTSNGKKVGYLNYMGFYMADDDNLIEAFRNFKAEGVSDLIVDLRYNPGGHVLSSVVLGTLIAGSAHKGEIYVRTTYNSARTAAGQVGDYKFGESANPERIEGYDKITEALNAALGLNTVYVLTTETTASASELVINGLRGVGVTVNTVGMPTNGKNVGMEGVRFNYRNYDFYFYPITFYCQNAKGFKDYSNGFEPGYKFDDSRYFPYDFGSDNDALAHYAMEWITTGSKPSSGRSMMSGNMIPLPMSDEMRAPLSRRMGGSIAMPE